MPRHLHGDGKTWLTGAVGTPKGSPGPINWPVDVVNADGEVERVIAKDETRNHRGDRTLRSTDARTFVMVHPSLRHVEVVEDES